MTKVSANISKDLGLHTIKGTIEPCSFHQQRVSLIEFDSEKEFCILPKGAGVDLVDLVSESMEIVGMVSETTEEEETRLFIQVRAYQAEDRF